MRLLLIIPPKHIIILILKQGTFFVQSKTYLDAFALVYTGSILLVITGKIARQFEFSAIRTELVKYANEQTAERTVVGALQIEICGRTGWFEAIVEPSKSYALIGAVVMESLDLVVEPRNQAIYPNPRYELPMTCCPKIMPA